MCFKYHDIWVKQHIYSILASQRRRLGLSQHELATRAGLRREKVNRVESRAEDISFEELCRLLDAVGLVLDVHEKGAARPPSSAVSAASLSHAARRFAPREFDKAFFVDGAKAKILSWGKVPR